MMTRTAVAGLASLTLTASLAAPALAAPVSPGGNPSARVAVKARTAKKVVKPAAARPGMTPTRYKMMRCVPVWAGGRKGLQAWPASVRSRIGAQFAISNIGGYRPGRGRSDHHDGLALDVMIKRSQMRKGDAVATWSIKNYKKLNISYVIWKQRIWLPGQGWRKMGNRGSATANHFDHVHISFRPGRGVCPSF